MPMTEYAESGTAVADQDDTDTTMTPAAAEQSFAMLPHNLIAPSKTNPRKTFDQAKLAELAESIAASGVHQPILVRPLPEHRLDDTLRNRKRGEPLPTHELVAGERRWRACQLAGVVEIPCLVKALTDHQVLEVQIVENLQRDDLSALEEAEGYAALVAATGITKDAIGERIGRSRTYVYGRLKLLDLCPPAREALREGKLDASRALLISRIPNDKLQIKALKEFCAKDYAGDSRMGHRAALQWIKQNVMLKLAEARFDTNDAMLLPDAGSCATCPKRTGFDPDLFADVDAPDLCTDTQCYQDKQAAHTAVIIAKARARGIEVIEGKEALELKPQTWGDPRGFRNLDGVAPYNPGDEQDKLLRDVLTKGEIREQVKLFIDPHTGEAIEVIPDALVHQVQSRMKRDAKPPGPVVESEEALQARAHRERHVLEVEYEQRWRAPAVEAIEGGLGCGMVTGFEAPVLRVILRALCDSEDADMENVVMPLLQIADGADYWDAVGPAIAAIPDTDLGVRICRLLLRIEGDNIANGYGGGGDITPTPVIDCLAATCQVDLQAIKADVQDAMRAEAAAQAGPAVVEKKNRKGKKAAVATP